MYMSIPQPKREQKYEYIPDDETRYEVAVDNLAAYIGLLHHQIWDEEAKEKPNQEKILALQEQCRIVVQERHEIHFEMRQLVRKALYIYGPILKAHWSKNNSGS